MKYLIQATILHEVEAETEEDALEKFHKDFAGTMIDTGSMDIEVSEDE